MIDKRRIFDLLEQIQEDQQHVYDENADSLRLIDSQRLDRIGRNATIIAGWVQGQEVRK